MAFGYVRAHPELFALDAGDLAALELVRHYTAGGIEQLTWAQTYEGVPAMDTSLTANLTEDGRLINVLGGPRPDLSVPLGGAGRRRSAAYASASRALEGRSSRPTGREADRADDRVRERRLGHARHLRGSRRPAPRLALLVHVDDLHAYDAVVDATTGTLVRQQNLVSDASATVYKNHPGCGVTEGRDSGDGHADPYLDNPTTATRLFGPTAHTFSDTPTPSRQPIHCADHDVLNGEIAPVSGHDWTYPVTAFPGCPSSAPCTGSVRRELLDRQPTAGRHEPPLAARELPRPPREHAADRVHQCRREL